MIDFAEIQGKLQDKGKVWVRLYGGLKICLVDTLDAITFKAKFLPCARNAREYIIKHTEIKEYAAREEAHD